MEKFSMASWVDIFQLLRSLMNYVKGSAKVADAPLPEAKKPAEGVPPTNILTAALSSVDEAVYCGNLKGLLTLEDEAAVDLLEAQMKSHQVRQFRLMILNMVNPDVSKNRMEPILGKDGKPTGSNKSVPYTVNHAFTMKDSRVLRLQSYAKRILAGKDVPAQEKLAKEIVAKLLKEGSITEQSMGDIGKEKLEGAKQAFADGAYAGVAFAQLGNEYTAIQSVPRASEATKAQRISAALDAKRIAKEAELESWGLKAVFKNKWTHAYGLLVISGLAYILFF